MVMCHPPFTQRQSVRKVDNRGIGRGHHAAGIWQEGKGLDRRLDRGYNAHTVNALLDYLPYGEGLFPGNSDVGGV